jgi:hypothetical protein
MEVEIPPKSLPSINTQKLELNFVRLKNKTKIKIIRMNETKMLKSKMKYFLNMCCSYDLTPTSENYFFMV